MTYTISEDWQAEGFARPGRGGLGGFIYGNTPEECVAGANAYLKEYPWAGYMTEFGQPVRTRAEDKWRVRFFRRANCE